MFTIVETIKKTGVADQPNHAAQVDALGLRAGLTRYEQLAEYCGTQGQSKPLLLIGARCIIIGIPGNAPVVYERKGNQRMPSMMTLARNFSAAVAQTVARAATGEPLRVSEQIQRQRFGICEKCPHIQGNRCVDVVMADGSLEKGCGCNLTAKTWLAGQECPQGKWKAE